MDQKKRAKSKAGPTRAFKPRWSELYHRCRVKVAERHFGNDQAVATIAALCASHQLRMEFYGTSDVVGPRCLIVGNSGSGKTQLAELAIALLGNIPKVYINATVLAPIGYKGVDLADCFHSVKISAKVNRENSILNTAITIDEFDKLILKGKQDDFYRSLELSMLPILGGEKLLLDDSGKDAKPKYLNTSSSLVFAMGFFNGIPRSAFNNPDKARKALVQFGFSPEIAGRFSHFVTLDDMSPPEMLKRVRLEVENLKPFYGLTAHDPKLPDSVLQAIIAKHKASDFGFRSIRSEVHQLLFKQAHLAACDGIGLPGA